MLTKSTIIGVMDIRDDGRIGVRDDTVYMDDGVEVARTFHRRVLDPGADLSKDTDARLVAIAGLIWTDDTVAAFRVAEAARRPPVILKPAQEGVE